MIIELAKKIISSQDQVQYAPESQGFEYVSRQVEDSFFSKIVSKYSSFSNGPWVAGGSVRKLWFDKPWCDQDIDFFFSSIQQFDEFCSMITKNVSSHTTHNTSNAITYIVEIDDKKIKIQAIKKMFYPSYHSLLANFDFNLTQFVTDGKTMLATTSAIQDCLDNMIRPNTAFNKTPVLRRVLKYSAYGFDPDPQLLIKSVGYKEGWYENEY